MAIDFSKVKKIIGPGGKEVKKIVRTSDGVVLWQKTANKVIFPHKEYTTSDFTLYYMGQAYFSFLGFEIRTGTFANEYEEQYKQILNLLNDGYKYYRCYFTNEHMWCVAKDSGITYADSKDIDCAFQTYGALTSYSDWPYYCTRSTLLNIQSIITGTDYPIHLLRDYRGCAFLMPAGTKTNWTNVSKMKEMMTSQNFLYINLLCVYGAMEYSNESARTTTFNNFNDSALKYFQSPYNNEFVMEFSKTGTET